MPELSTVRVAARRGNRRKLTTIRDFDHSRKNNKRQRRGGGHFKNVVDHANGLFKTGEYESALAHLRKHGAKHVSNAQLQKILGKVHTKLNHPNRARAAFKTAHSLNPKDPETVKNYAQALEGTYDLQVESVMYHACQLDGGFKAKNLMMLGNFYRTWGDQYPEYKELALVCYLEASERTNFTGEPEVLYENLRQEMGVETPATKEMNVIAERMAFLGVQSLSVNTSRSYRLDH